MSRRKLCIICNEHRAEKGPYCARCWTEFQDDIQRDAPWIVQAREAAEQTRQKDTAERKRTDDKRKSVKPYNQP